MFVAFWSSTWPFLSPLADVLVYMTQSILKVYTDQSMMDYMHAFFSIPHSIVDGCFPFISTHCLLQLLPSYEGPVPSLGVSQRSEIWWVKTDLLFFFDGFCSWLMRGDTKPFQLHLYLQLHKKIQKTSSYPMLGNLHFPSEMRSTPLWHMPSSITVHHSSPNYSCYKLATQMARKSGKKKKNRNLKWTECKHYVSCGFISMLLENEEFPPRFWYDMLSYRLPFTRVSLSLQT